MSGGRQAPPGLGQQAPGKNPKWSGWRGAQEGTMYWKGWKRKQAVNAMAG